VNYTKKQKDLIARIHYRTRVVHRLAVPIEDVGGDEDAVVDLRALGLVDTRETNSGKRRCI
jgi:hypothetical protein